MEKKKFISKRPEINISEVENRYDGCNMDDLFHAAEEGDLTIYFQPSFNCEVGYFASIKRAAFLYQNVPFEKLSDEQKKSLSPYSLSLKLSTQ